MFSIYVLTLNIKFYCLLDVMLLFIIEPITKHAIWYLIFCSCFFFFKNLQRETTENARKLYKNTSLCHFHRSIFLTFLATLNKSQFFRYFKVKRIFNQKWKQKPSFNHKKRAKVCVKTKLCTWERKTLQPLSPLDGVPWLKHKVPLLYLFQGYSLVCYMALFLQV